MLAAGLAVFGVVVLLSYEGWLVVPLLGQPLSKIVFIALEIAAFSLILIGTVVLVAGAFRRPHAN
jgi:hypothetical protein